MFGFLNFLKLFPADGAINFIDWLMRKIGPALKRHKLMIANLRNAFPEKSDAEIEDIALGSWANMGRLAAEYVFLDRLFDFDPENPSRAGWRFRAFRSSWTSLTIRGRSSSLPPIPAISSCCRWRVRRSGLYVSVLFRPPNNPYVAHKVFDFRKRSHGQAGALACRLFLCAGAQLEAGGGVGVLVDQKFRKGLKTNSSAVRSRPIRCWQSWCASSIAKSIRPAASGLPATAIALRSSRRSKFRAMPTAISTWPRRRSC
jgi:KDO2-lipid IV(A) lauroyltransferase